MTEQYLHGLQVVARGQGQRRRAVAQVVEPHRWQISLDDQSSERVRHVTRAPARPLAVDFGKQITARPSRS
ncbi:hypothetical protein [Amycolatopsis sp. NPDC049159]|uniref:hypothetical protein n=1 Tax=Amycolatopsis sp. NPDC049159 TaxID=3157210 RepID=UPI0033EEB97A